MRGWLMALALGMVLPLAAGAQQSRPADWIQDAETGCRIWNPQPQDNESARWSGQCVDGHAEGAGELRWFVDSQLQATDTISMRRGKQHGKVVSRRADGDVLEFTYENGLAQGPASARLPNGDVENWTFVNGKTEGVLTTTYANGDRLEEDWKDDKPLNIARMTWRDGRRYAGGWLDGRPHGTGELRDAQGQLLASGQWTSGCFRDGDNRHAIGASRKDCGFE